VGRRPAKQPCGWRPSDRMSAADAWVDATHRGRTSR
jgi:hypothetical protein